MTYFGVLQLSPTKRNFVLDFFFLPVVKSYEYCAFIVASGSQVASSRHGVARALSLTVIAYFTIVSPLELE